MMFTAGWCLFCLSNFQLKICSAGTQKATGAKGRVFTVLFKSDSCFLYSHTQGQSTEKDTCLHLNLNQNRGEEDWCSTEASVAPCFMLSLQQEQDL